MKTGNTWKTTAIIQPSDRASMEPGHEDREYSTSRRSPPEDFSASMEPGHEDREYISQAQAMGMSKDASMEPGHEDREYVAKAVKSASDPAPQWSPVMKTGNTRPTRPASPPPATEPQWSPVMKTGNTRAGGQSGRQGQSLNGARS